MSIKYIETDSISKICSCLKNIEYSKDPLVIKGGLYLYNLDEWEKFLTNECGFILDNRHPNYLSHEIERYSWWEISYQPDKATSFAYSNTPQPLHNDNAWFKNGADFNFNIMKKQVVNGGESTYYSVDKIINDLNKKNPSLLEKLLTIPVTISKGKNEFSNRTTIISKKQNNYRIFWNYFRINKDDSIIKKMVNDFFNFLKTQEENGFVNCSKFEEGDCFVWNDSLLLHGRKSFEAQKPFDRVINQSMWYFSE
ncbi:TauD/TfdA family dioxygenase [Candidatus Pelagibacter sp.]|nr:TauD/TfdA family dioxygenase [Candidatus Pelagibacter sp.]